MSNAKDKNLKSKQISGLLNTLNGIVHIVLIIYLFTVNNAFTVNEKKMGIIMPIILTIINLSFGILTLINKIGPLGPTIWNSFVVITGILIPTVWKRFFTTGLKTWPLIPKILWIIVFICEFGGALASLVWYTHT